MKLISLWEPWATLMALCFKRVETRDWITAYRGPLAIHASKHGMSLQDTLATCLQTPFYNALMTYPSFREQLIHFPQINQVDKRVMKACFPNRGKIVCIVDLKNTWPTETIKGRYPDIMTPAEFAFGNYDPVDADSGNARHGWVTEFTFKLPEPIPFTSKQGLVNVPHEVHQELRCQWNLENK